MPRCDYKAFPQEMSILAFEAAGNPSVFHDHDVPGISENNPVAELRADPGFLAGIKGNCEIMKKKALPLLAQW